MRRLLLIGVIALSAGPLFATRRVTVDQLEQALSSAVAKHRSDEELARQLGDMQLSERLTTATLEKVASRLPPYPHTALALRLLADESAVLDPPRSELPATEPPDLATEKRILAGASAYVLQTIPRLPNFLATRTTVRFDDTAQVLHPGEWPIRAGFHMVGSTSRGVTVRDGVEVADSAQAGKVDATMGLYSFGEFGPILARTLADLPKGKLQFSHWEDSELGVVAVFSYSVPRHESHYQVHFCCLVDREFQGGPSYRSRNLPRYHSGDPNPVETKGLVAYDATPAYHGTLSVDPVTGAIMRMTLDAELDPDNPIQRASTVVEYGRVAIGDQTFICPVRSLAISAQQGKESANGEPQGPPVVSINETIFSHYHRFGSSARMIADGSVPASGGSAQESGTALVPSPPAQGSDPAQPVAETASAAGAAPPPPQPATPAETGSAAPAPAPSAPAPEAAPEISTSAATGIPDIPTSAAAAQDSGFSLTMTSRLVDVGVTAFDKKGRPVTDLKQEDFEVYDDGRKQAIHFFSAPGPIAAPPAAATAAAPTTVTEFANRNTAPAAPLAAASAPAPEGGTILLIDESHIAWNDLNYARGQVLKFLSTVAPGERVGLYSMTGLGFRVLVEITGDHAAVAAGLKAFLPSAQSVNEAQEEERRNRQQFATVHNVADLNSVNGNHGDVPDGEQPVDPELLTMGSNPARSAMIILAQVARHLAAIPGHKNLVWVSSDNVFADWGDQSAGVDKGPRDIQSYSVRVQEAMNDAHAAVYPFDVSQLEAGGVGADLQHSNVQLEQAAAENAATAASAGGAGGSGSVQASNRDTGIGRISAQMSQDVHPIQGPVRAVADATGGRTVRRSGDLAAALNSIVEDGRATYQLSFSPAGPPDDRHHAITVRLTGKRGVTLRYRTGYLFEKEAVSLKERFRQAVWRPTETGEIGLTASIANNGSDPTIRLTVAGGDVGLAQQGGRWMDKLDIFYIQRDDAGINAHLEGQTLGLRLKPETYQKVLSAGIPVEHSVTMQRGMGSVRILVVDENSGRMGSVTIPAAALASGK